MGRSSFTTRPSANPHHPQQPPPTKFTQIPRPFVPLFDKTNQNTTSLSDSPPTVDAQLSLSGSESSSQSPSPEPDKHRRGIPYHRRKQSQPQTRQPTPGNKRESASRELLRSLIEEACPTLGRVSHVALTDSGSTGCGYRWVFKGYEFPRRQKGDVKTLSVFTISEHEELAEAIRDGTLGVELAEDDEVGRVSDRASDESETEEDEDEADPQNVTESDSSGSESGSPSKRKRRSRQQFYQAGAFPRAMASKEAIRQHLKNTLGIMLPLELIYLHRSRNRSLGYGWKFSANYSRFPADCKGKDRTVKSIQLFTKQEHAELQAALEKGWLRAAKVNEIDKNSGSEGSSESDRQEDSDVEDDGSSHSRHSSENEQSSSEEASDEEEGANMSHPLIDHTHLSIT
ncbi:hypothetical protein BJ508DRAFT_324077 [Ascobolus immersus RN42]|uniref:Uncharacterized protein n=1 Tax=Ascobolus immersus RN42 TaxID=1160509 RepID=A0A3N4IIU5_ASCIM|nr:hypothetical protein BJ508DRAFT_324077 [Ascobolus immersus RN42]